MIALSQQRVHVFDRCVIGPVPQGAARQLQSLDLSSQIFPSTDGTQKLNKLIVMDAAGRNCRRNQVKLERYVSCGVVVVKDGLR